MDITAGQVVEFLENQRFVCALCLGKKGSRYRILTHSGKEATISSNRLTHISAQLIKAKGRQAQLLALKDINARRTNLKKLVNLPELWELVHDEQGSWNPGDLADLAFETRAGPDHEAAFIRAVIEDKTYFKFRDAVIAALTPEAVERLLEQKTRNEEMQARISAGNRWLKKLWSGTENHDNDAGMDDDPHIAYWISALKDYTIYGDESKEASAVKELFKKAGLKSPSAPFDTLVKAGIWDEHENLELLRHGVSASFSMEVLQEAEILAGIPIDAEAEGRIDLTNMPTFTIDAPESMDLDDALSFAQTENGWEIGIHITDVGSQISPGSRLFDEAIQRATSIYLPDQTIPMLPEILSQDAWSLKAGVPRRALSFLIHINDKGMILGSGIKRSVIQVHERLSYEEAERKITEEPSFAKLYNLCTERLARRIEEGALPLPVPELNIQIDERHHVKIELSEPGPARFAVAECMILANFVAAQFLCRNGVPALYRSQPEPRERIMEGDDTDLLTNLRQRRLISRGKLGPEPEAHAGLGLEVYTTITSPLRRGLDLLMQQQITSVLATGKPLHSEEQLERISIFLKEGLMTAAIIRQSRTRYWLLKALEARRDSRMKAIVLEAGPRKVLVVTVDYLNPIELRRLPGRNYTPGQEVTITIKKVSARENILKVDWNIEP